MTRIEDRTFADSGMPYVTLNDELTYISDTAFEGCSPETLALVANYFCYAMDYAAASGFPYYLPPTDFSYIILEDNTISIYRYGGNKQYKVAEVPAKIHGYRVVGIEPRAFEGYKLAQVIFPEGLTYIGREPVFPRSTSPPR